MLWVALELPALPLQLLERARAVSVPLVVTEGPAQRPTVAFANASARVAGVREGTAVAAARALCDTLACVARNPASEREALERLAGWALQFTPAVSVEPTGIALEVESSARLFGGFAPLLSLVRSGVRALGFEASIGVAPTPLAARVLARAHAHRLPARGCMRLASLPERLAEQPLFLLEWPGETLQRLADLGIVRIKDAMALPRTGFSRRFGPEALLLLDQLTGRVPDPRKPHAPAACVRVRLELLAEAEGVEAILFPLKRLLAEMEGTLRGQGAGVQEITLILEQGRRHERVTLAFATPEREAEFLLAIARERLGRLQIAAPVTALRLVAEQLHPFVPRNESWLPGREEQAVGRARLVEKLSARLGAGCVFGIALADDHRPERSWQPASPEVPSVRFDGGPRPAWLLNRPQKLIAREGVPRLQGELALLAGPERIETGWWDGEAVQRDYYVAANPAGERLWVYRERGEAGAWFLHGVFA